MIRRTFLLAAGAAAVTRTLGAASAARLRIGQIGVSHAHASGKMQALRAPASDWEVVGLAVSAAERSAAATLSRAYEGVPLVTEDALLGRRDVHAVAVETRVKDSCATAVRAIRAGKHVHLDKPGALEHAEFKAMRLEAQDRGLTVQMGYMLRYHPAFELLFRAVREGWLGEVTEVDASMGKLGSAADRATLAALPGGGMFELGCHLIDAVVTMLGKPRAVHAVSTPSRDDGVKDNQLAVLEYRRAAASVRIDLADPFGSPRRRFSVTGTGGTFEIWPLESGNVKLSLTVARESYRKGTQDLRLERRGGRYDAEFVDLARIIRGGKPLAWSAAHDIAVHETLLEACGVAPPARI